MTYEFKDMATVDLLETVNETATVLVEDNGVIKRAPKGEVGGTGIKDVIINVTYDDSSESHDNTITFEDTVINPTGYMDSNTCTLSEEQMTSIINFIKNNICRFVYINNSSNNYANSISYYIEDNRCIHIPIGYETIYICTEDYEL